MKLMKFVSIEPERFDPYLVADFYKKAIIATNSKSFKTKVYNTKLTTSALFLAEEFGLSNTGTSIFTYLDGNANIEKIHWMRWKKQDYTQSFKQASSEAHLTRFLP